MTSLENIQKYVRSANYLSVSQIYLQDNFLLKKPLSTHDIKPKLFGHWGSCPGINFVYAFTNYLAKKYKKEAIFVLGPGHGFAALQANLFMEGTLGKYYPQAQHDEGGVAFLCKSFSWPYGFSSHSCPEAPGLILEGGELGYSLSTSFGAVMDNPDLLAVCLIGDGEAETGPLAAAWHLNKLLDPATNGAVLPILHLNGYKISGPTVFARMSDSELNNLFKGLGYQPLIVSGRKIYQKMLSAMERSYQKIAAIQTRAKRGEVFSPIYPMIILKTAKGWTGIKNLRGTKIEGTINAHQVVAANCKNDALELSALEKWLKSYHFEELFDEKKGFSEDILSLVPEKGLKVGDQDCVFGRTYQKLNLPKVSKLEKEVDVPGKHLSNSMRLAGTYFREVFELNRKQRNFRLMSPDETYSNRLDEVFEETNRAFVWPHQSDDNHLARDGRVMEMLSEHNLHGLSQGYILTGRHGVFATYEAFAQIISSMAHQYIKFLKAARETVWREDISSMNYILSSSAWRQEHNGYSHQNPSFISGLLEKNHDFVKVYFPVDENSMLVTLDEVMGSKNAINTIVAGKTQELRWLNLKSAKQSLKNGLLTWDFASDPDPDVVVVGIGDYVSKECLAAIDILKKDIPYLKLRFVNILRLSAACTCQNEYHPPIADADHYFTVDKPVIVNFHGYPQVMKAILFDQKNPHRFSIHGYQERGGTTTPFDMLARNNASRFHLALEVLQKAQQLGVIEQGVYQKFTNKYTTALTEHQAFVKLHGKDPEDIESWQWQAPQLDNLDPEQVEKIDILKESRTIAMIGLSDKPHRTSYRVANYLKSRGFKIIPVNPNISQTLGEKAYPNLGSIPKKVKIDIVDIFRKPEEVIPHMQEVIERGGIKSVWLQDGVSSLKAEEFAQDFGLTLVSNFCIMDACRKIQQ